MLVLILLAVAILLIGFGTVAKGFGLAVLFIAGFIAAVFAVILGGAALCDLFIAIKKYIAKKIKARKEKQGS
jgi:hypothetical protein